ncbi:MAG TPA: YihY/virulence factor BrkB family protein [Sediminispirochaeta sp.]|nr:YihY/virulence factor BrkB family protein [Sediminispirochaeta sp.]
MEKVTVVVGELYRSFRNFVHRVAREFVLDHCLLRSSSLAFSTLLALVPLTAFIFSLFTSFGAFEAVKSQAQQFLIEFFIPTRTEEVMSYFDYFLENTRALGVLGFFFFAVTSIGLINGVSINLNAIWGSSSHYGYLGKFLKYLAGLVLAALFLSLGFTFTPTVARMLGDYPEVSFFFRWLLKVLPRFLIFAIIWLMIYAVPAAKVSLSSSLIGAFVGMIMWELARYVFIDGTNYMIRISVIYGSIAAVPVFLIWLSIDWVIIFLSAEISYVHQHRYFWWREKHDRQMSPRQQLLMGLRLYFHVSQNFFQGRAPESVKSLAHRFAVSSGAVEFFVNKLQAGGLLFKSPNGNPLILPGRDLSQVSMADLLRVLLGLQPETPSSDEYSQSLRIVEEFIDRGTSSFEDTTVLDVLHEKMAKADSET